ncbi:unnamed protein product [Mytilus edulis]|uniref:Reverse transcriptase domain-containing protein n=1 Tax=Mytilus edulis TaxID=6550 RepID=A0A8S3RZC8_MYTED|nr:unnamed protein product [Mytilus edulis]
MASKRQQWISCNRPRGEHVIFQEYKSAKRNFRRELRNAYQKHMQETYNSLEKDFDIDQKRLWSFLNKNKKSKSCLSRLIVNGRQCSTQDDILDGWAEHFESIFKQNTETEPVSDKERAITKTVEVAHKDFRGTFYNNTKLNITVNEVEKVLKCLKNNKASGLDNIEYEHLKYGGNSLRNHMTKLFNLVCYNFYSPKSWKSSLIVPLFKGGNKCKSDPNSYRGISLAPCIGKVLDKIIDLKLELKKDNKCFPNPQQTAYQQCLSRGILVTDIHISSPVQADDIALISTNCCNMQTMVTICENYSIDWKFKFNPLKSIQLNFSKSKQHTDILLYNSSIQLEISARHVGVLLNSNLNSMDRTLQACRTLRSSALGLIKSGLHPSVISIDTCNRIVRQVCFTKAFFGCELWTEITNTEILLLERAQRYVCKSIQGLPRQTRSDMVNALIGWKSAESYIDERKLLFLGKLVLMKDSMLPKQIFLTRAMEFKYNCVETPAWIYS